MASPDLVRSRVLLGLLAGVCLAAFLGSIPLPRADGQLLGTDGFGYYVYLPSVVLDGDLDFSSQLEALIPNDAWRTQPRTVTGLVGNPWPVGPALLWAPWFLLAHLLALGIDAVGGRIPLHGCGYWHQAFVITGNIVYGGIGLLLAFEVARRVASTAAALWSCVLLLCAGNLVYYLTAEPSMAHAVSAFAVGAFYLTWMRTRGSRSAGRAVALGALAGLIAIVRTQELMLVAVPLASDAVADIGWRPGRESAGRLLAWARFGAVFAFAAAVVYLPQAVASRVLYGSWWSPPQLHAHAEWIPSLFFWSSPHMGDVLVSSWRGLFSWHPVYLAAVAGAWALWRKDRAMAVALLFGVAAEAYVTGGWYQWWQGRAFGGRTFIGCLPLFAMGLAALLDRVETVRSSRRQLVVRLIAGAGVCLVAANLLLFIEYRVILSRTSAPATWDDLGAGRLRALTVRWR